MVEKDFQEAGIGKPEWQRIALSFVKVEESIADRLVQKYFSIFIFLLR